jgi:hypothetical protein
VHGLQTTQPLMRLGGFFLLGQRLGGLLDFDQANDRDHFVLKRSDKKINVFQVRFQHC